MDGRDRILTKRARSRFSNCSFPSPAVVRPRTPPTLYLPVGRRNERQEAAHVRCMIQDSKVSPPPLRRPGGRWVPGVTI